MFYVVKCPQCGAVGAMHPRPYGRANPVMDMCKHGEAVFADSDSVPICSTIKVVDAPVTFEVTRDATKVQKTYVTAHWLNESLGTTVSTDAWTHDNGFQEQIRRRLVRALDHYLALTYAPEWEIPR